MNDPCFTARLHSKNRIHFLRIFQYIKEFNAQCQMRFDDNGMMRIQVSDPSHVSMLNICIDRTFFSSVVGRGEIGVSSVTIVKILSFLEGDIQFEYNAEKARLKIWGCEGTFETSCYEIDSELFEFPLDDIALMSPIEIFGDASTNDIIETVRKWSSRFQAEYVSFSIVDDTLSMETDTDETNIKVAFSIIGGQGNWNAKIRANYFTQLKKTQAVVTIYWKNDFPIMIEELGEDFKIQTFIAPQMEDTTVD